MMARYVFFDWWSMISHKTFRFERCMIYDHKSIDHNSKKIIVIKMILDESFDIISNRGLYFLPYSYYPFFNEINREL